MRGELLLCEALDTRRDYTGVNSRGATHPRCERLVFASAGALHAAIASNASSLLSRGRSLTPLRSYLSFSAQPTPAAVAELADALDSGSSVQKTCRFNSCRPHIPETPGKG